MGRGLASAFALCLACGGADSAVRGAAAGSTLEAEQAASVGACEGPQAPPPTGLEVGEPLREVRLYLDGSRSMQGFAAQGGTFSAVLAALRPVLLDLEIDRSSVALVGGSLGSFVREGNLERFDEPGHFLLDETNLAAVLDEELRRAATPGLAMVITDGVMSLRADAGEELVDCQRGSDVHCLSVKVRKLVEKGRGFWIVGLRSRFHGVLFSETLKPGGGSLGVRELPDRPFYLWVMASNPVLGRRLVDRLFARLGAPGKAGFALELAPGRLPLLVPRSEQAPASDSGLFAVSSRLGASKGKYTPGSPGRAGKQVVAHSGLEGTAFGLRLALALPELRDLPASLQPLWSYQADYCLRWTGNGPAPGLQARLAAGETDLRLALQARSFARFAGRQAVLTQRLERQAGHGLSLPSLAPWSTRDDRSASQGNRTLYLEEFLLALEERLRPPDLFEQPLLELHFE